MKIKTRLRSALPRAARVSVPAVLGLGLLGFAVPATASASTATTYTGSAQASGLVINLFGTQLTGGTAKASVDSAVPSADAEGVGTLTPGMVEDQKASASGNSTSQTKDKACSQGGGSPASSPIGVTLGLACSSALANVTADGVPSAAATGEIAGLDVNLSGVLNQIISSGGNQLFAGIQQVLGQLNGSPLGTGTTACPDTSVSSSSVSTAGNNTASGTSSSQSTTGVPSNPLTALAGTASVPGSPLNTLLGSLGLGSSTAASSPGPLGGLLQGLCQTLTNIEHVVALPNPPSTLVVDVGPASASVGPDAYNNNVPTAKADGATAEVQVLPGVGCDAASLADCILHPAQYAVPLIDIKVAPAHASSTWDGTSWAPKTTDSLATVDLNIPGSPETISIPAGQSQDLLAGTPLETVIDLGSASTSGSGSTAGGGSGGGGGGTDTVTGASLDLAKGVNGGILLDLGTIHVAGNGAAAPTSSLKNATIPPVVAAKSSPPAAAPAVAPIASPTLVHTGAWWSGSLPYLAGIAALGGGLLGWPRLRRGGKGLGTLLRAARR